MFQRDCRNCNSSYHSWPLSHGCFQSEKEVDLKKPVNVYQLVQLTQILIAEGIIRAKLGPYGVKIIAACNF